MNTTSSSVLKSPNDKCNYYVHRLENGLNIFIVNDESTDMSCAAMMVKIGHMYDNIPGMTHFLEHMLFNGTKKYPKEGYFSEFISKNGGMTNAYTSHNHTCYYYTVQSSAFNQSLDIFSQFFTNPLIDKDSVSREKEAVNAEHIKNMANDAWRSQEILRKACLQTHPIQKFGTGSNKTLDVPNIDKLVREFYETHYSSDLMTLVILTKNDPVDTFNNIKILLSDIPLRITKENRTIISGRILDSPKLIKFIPITDSDHLLLNWEMPSFYNSITQSPIDFLANVLGHEGRNTIHYLLTNKKYICNLSAGAREIVGDKCIFSIDMQLTPLGQSNMGEIVSAIFSYIEIMKKESNKEKLEMLYNEYIRLKRFEFKYLPNRGEIDKVLSYCNTLAMYDFPIRYLPSILHTYEEFVPNVKRNLYVILENMTLQNTVIISSSKKFIGETNLEDEHYGTQYSIFNNFDNFLKVALDTINPLDLPPTNPYISTDEKMIEIRTNVPQKIQNNNINVWWMPTNEFSIPNVYVCVSVDIPCSLIDKEINTKIMLYLSSLMRDINHEKYLCDMAGYSSSAYMADGKLYIFVNGNYGKISNVCRFIVNSLINKKLITNANFETAKYVMKTSDKNFAFESPWKRLSVFFNKSMCHKFYSQDDRLSVIDSLTRDNTIDIIDDILNVTAVTMLVSGNVTELLANELAQIFAKFVPKKIHTPDTIFIDTYGTPNTCNDCNIFSSDNEHEVNSAGSVNVFIGKIQYGLTENWNRYICLLNILDNVISSNYYDNLRTKEKYGYVVGSSKLDAGDQRFISKYYTFVTQSPHKSANEIIDRTKLFIREFKDTLSQITEDEFTELKMACITELLSPFRNLKDKSRYIFNNEIETNYVLFNLKDVLVETYKLLTKDDLLSFYEEKFINLRSISIGINKK